jgi:hypothetical protein
MRDDLDGRTEGRPGYCQRCCQLVDHVAHQATLPACERHRNSTAPTSTAWTKDAAATKVVVFDVCTIRRLILDPACPGGWSGSCDR